MTISKDRVKPSPYPNSWNLSEIFTYAIVYGIYLAASTVAFFAVIVHTSFFHDKFGREQFIYENNDPTRPGWNDPILHSIIYLQVSTISQALIFITRSRSFFFLERPSIILVVAFIVAQMIATFIAVYANWGFTDIRGCGWAWAAIVWVWNIIWFFPLDLIKVRCGKSPSAGVRWRLSLSLSSSLSELTSILNASKKWTRYYQRRRRPSHSVRVVRVPLVVDQPQVHRRVVPRWSMAKVACQDETRSIWPPRDTTHLSRNI